MQRAHAACAGDVSGSAYTAVTQRMHRKPARTNVSRAFFTRRLPTLFLGSIDVRKDFELAFEFIDDNSFVTTDTTPSATLDGRRPTAFSHRGPFASCAIDFVDPGSAGSSGALPGQCANV